MTPTKTRGRGLKLVVKGDNKLDLMAAKALLLETAPGGGYIREIANTIAKRTASGNAECFLISVTDSDGTPLSVASKIAQVSLVVNKHLKTHNSKFRVRWIESDPQGQPVRKFLVVPLDMYKEVIGLRGGGGGH